MGVLENSCLRKRKANGVPCKFYLCIMRLFLPLFLILTICACQPPTRDCDRFHTGSFRFTAVIDGTEETTVFERTENLEISKFKGKTDSASVRWINACEYIVTNLNPGSREEEKSIHMKILTTTEDSYTFEYKLVGTSRASRGTAYKTD